MMCAWWRVSFDVPCGSGVCLCVQRPGFVGWIHGHGMCVSVYASVALDARLASETAYSV